MNKECSIQVIEHEDLYGKHLYLMIETACHHMVLTMSMQS